MVPNESKTSESKTSELQTRETDARSSFGRALPSPSAETLLTTPRNRFYSSVWRWHFYAGLFVIPFMLILATTGIIYLFKPQLDTAMYRDLLFVQPAAADVSSLSYSQQVQAAQQAYPNATVTKFLPTLEAERSAEVIVATADARQLAVFVDPYSHFFLTL